MRIADIQLSFPYLMVAIFISAIFQLAFGIGRNEDLAVPLLIVIIGLAEWPVYARTVRAAVMGEKNKEYVEAARVIGLNRWRIMFRHVLPNTMTSVLVISTIQVANAVMSEAALSFLGLGVRPPTASWGGILADGRAFILRYPHIAIYPGIMIVITVLAFNFLGDGLRDALDPRQKS